jgi:hypothetical protein
MRIEIVLLIVFLGVFPNHSSAQWQLVDVNSEQDKYYLNFDNLRFEKNFVFYEILADYYTPVYGAKSSKTSVKGDCRSPRMKILADKYSTKNLGKGSVVGGSQIPSIDWTNLPEDSVFSVLLRFVCRRQP